jgi:hypothetical protein
VGEALGADCEAAVRRAAAELAVRLKKLAGTLTKRQAPTRVRYGRGRLGNSLRRQSPEGFVLDPNLQMLLPDGRLWTYSHSDSSRFPAGRYYDAASDYIKYAGTRTFPGGREFVFLGAVLGKFTFGFGGATQAQSPGLCAIYGSGRAVRYAAADEAFATIAEPTFSQAGNDPG